VTAVARRELCLTASNECTLRLQAWGFPVTTEPNVAPTLRDESSHECRTSLSSDTSSGENFATPLPRAKRYVQRIVKPLVAVLTYDFCPSANRFLHWLKHPVGFLVIAGVVSGTFALFLNAFAWVAFGAIAVILTLGFAWPWIALKGLNARLVWDAKRGCEGERVTARLRIQNRCPWPVWGLSVQGGFRKSGPSAALARVCGMSEVEFCWDFVPNERGIYPVAIPQLETGFPFGLWRAQRSVSVEQELIVWPKTVRLNELPDMTSSQPSEEHLSDRRAGDLGDILGTRSFRQGDSLRRVHWAQSARHQRLVVTERQSGVESRACVRIDVAQDNHVGTGSDSTLNATLRFAASICQALDAEHTHVDCILGGELICLSQTGGLRRLMDALAHVPERGLPEVAAAQSRHYDGREIVCTTDRRRHEDETGNRSKCGRREVVIAAGSSDDVGPSTHLSTRRPWLFIPPGQVALSEFSQQWQRACRIA